MASRNDFAECESPHTVHVKLKKLLCCEYLQVEKCSENFEKFKVNCEEHFTTPAKKQVFNPDEIIEQLKADGIIRIGDYGKLKSLVKDIDVDMVTLIEDAENRIRSLERKLDDPSRKRKREEEDQYQEQKDQTAFRGKTFLTAEEQVSRLLMRYDVVDVKLIEKKEYIQTVEQLVSINRTLSTIAFEVNEDPNLQNVHLKEWEKFTPLIFESTKILGLIYHLDEASANLTNKEILKLAEQGKKSIKEKSEFSSVCEENWRIYNKQLKSHIAINLFLKEQGAELIKRFIGSVIFLLQFESKHKYQNFVTNCQNGVIRDAFQNILITADFLDCFRLTSAKVEISIDQEECLSLLDEQSRDEIQNLISETGRDKEDDNSENDQEEEPFFAKKKQERDDKNDWTTDRYANATLQMSDTIPKEQSNVEKQANITDKSDLKLRQISTEYDYASTRQGKESDFFRRRSSSDSFIVQQQRKATISLRRTQSDNFLPDTTVERFIVSRQLMQEKGTFQKKKKEETGTIPQQIIKEMDPLRYRKQDNKHETADESNIVRQQTTYKSSTFLKQQTSTENVFLHQQPTSEFDIVPQPSTDESNNLQKLTDEIDNIKLSENESKNTSSLLSENESEDTSSRKGSKNTTSEKQIAGEGIPGQTTTQSDTMKQPTSEFDIVLQPSTDESNNLQKLADGIDNIQLSGNDSKNTSSLLSEHESENTSSPKGSQNATSEKRIASEGISGQTTTPSVTMKILPLFVVGIDFGTTYSGWAYASRHDYLSNPLKVFTFHWQNGGKIMLKTNTCILFDEEGRLDGRYDSCGYDAYEKYVQLCSQKKQEKYYFFTDYKMILYENMEISSKSMIKADNGKEMNALTVFSETIRFFAEHFKKENAKLYEDVTDDEIHWVLTVPAIWNEKAKSFMREAAVQAGIPTNQLQIALEPEAAALYCKNLPIRNDERLFSVFQQNTTFMVVDIGGGTYDITVNRVTKDGLEELYMANGGNFGGNNVNDEFWNLLSTVYGSDTIEKLKKKFPDEYLDLDLDFEIKKKSLELNDTGLDMYFRVPVALKQIFTEGKSEEDIAKACNPENFHGAIEVDLKRGKLRIKRKVLVNLFRLPISELTQRLSELLSKPELYNLDAVLLVGGFADSPILYEKVKASLKLENKNILILKPPNAVSAVVKGSVYFGHEPDVFSKRVCRYTYGIETHEPFDKTLDFETKLVLDDDGVKYCKSRFSKHVTIGDKIEVGTFTTGVIYLPMKDYQETVQFPVFVSMEQNPRYTDDRCTYLGSLSIDLSNLPREKEEIEVSILFGETELATVRAREIKTGKEVHAELSFLG